MSSSSRRKSLAVVDRLAESGHAYNLIQATRLIERSCALLSGGKDKPFSRVGSFMPPEHESIRYQANSSFAFPSGEVQQISKPAANNKPWGIEVNLMGLTGATGVMPYHYTETLHSQIKIKDHTLERFLDLFNHRILSLFYRALTKYQLALQYEAEKLSKSKTSPRDSATQALLSLIGIGTPGHEDRLHIKDESLIHYSGLFNQKVRNASSLQQMLGDYFKIPVEVNQFIGQWQDLIDDVRSMLPDFDNPMGRNVQLGRSAMLGKRGWVAQAKIQIILGPLNKEQLAKFEPGTLGLKALNQMTRMYLGMEHDFEFIIRMREKDLPRGMSLSDEEKPILGWNSWMTNPRKTLTKAEETRDIRVSGMRYR
jgi:type VI secretion system protein ImpH